MSASTIAFAICSSAALLLYILAYRGVLNVYFYGGNSLVKPQWHKPLWAIILISYVVGLVLTLI